MFGAQVLERPILVGWGARSVGSSRVVAATSPVVMAAVPKRWVMASSARLSVSAARGGGREEAQLGRRRGQQILGRHAGQAGGAGRLAFQQARRLPVDRLAVVGRLVQRHAAGDQREVAAFQLQLHGAGAHARPPQPVRHPQRLGVDVRPQRLDAGQILVEGLLGADALGVAIGDHRARDRWPGRAPTDRGRRGPNRCSRKAGPRARPASPTVAIPMASKPRFALLGPMPHSRATGSGARNAAPPSARHLQLAVRLGEVGGDLGDQLHRRDARPRRAGPARRRCGAAGRGRSRPACRTGGATR